MTSPWDRWGALSMRLRRAARARPALPALLDGASDAAGHVYAIHLYRASGAAAEPEAIGEALLSGSPDDLLEHFESDESRWRISGVRVI